jgi:uncharacterized membrane protein YccF (DUF307 family)
MPLKQSVRYWLIRIEHSPFLQIRQAWWIIFCGWWMFLTLAFLGIFLCATIIGIPFGIQAFKLAILGKFICSSISSSISNSLKKKNFFLKGFCPVGYNVETYADPGSNPLKKPTHPLSIFLNIIWLFFVGWLVALEFLFAGIIQVLTIIGIPSSFNTFKLMGFALWPFGRHRVKAVPPPIPPRSGTVQTETPAGTRPIPYDENYPRPVGGVNYGESSTRTGAAASPTFQPGKGYGSEASPSTPVQVSHV